MLVLGCTKLVFEKPIPKNGEMVQVLPEYFNGKFLKNGEQTYYDIERLSEKHALVYATEWFHKDSINSLIESLKNESTYAELREDTLFIKAKDSVQKIKLTQEKDIYYTEKEPVYEINLDDGYFIDDFDEKQKKKALLKYHKQKYFLNIIDAENKWFAAWFENKNDSLIIRHSQIADTSFLENLSYYNKLTNITYINDDAYLANPTDEELFKLIDEPNLFTEEIWIRVYDNQQWNIVWIIAGVTLLLLFIIFILIKKPTNYKRSK